ncbi:hypothetical protein [Streptomyces sp. NPDC003036]|uniref:hypothetical protein n=1 Tax=Streptomyces sp. NPDC003036 TaxID=3154442 RepID=UPI0033B42950
MNKKYLLLAVAVVVAAAVITAVNLWPTERKELRARNLCLGMLSEATAGLLHDGKGGRVVVDEDTGGASGAEANKPADPVFSTICFVGRQNAGAATTRIQYTLDVRPADARNAATKDTTPIGGGRSGWVGPRQSEVQLPAACGKEMGTTARYVTLTLKISPAVLVEEDWNTTSLIASSRTILLESVGNLAKQYDCA